LKKNKITKLHGRKYPKGTHYCATHVEHAEYGVGTTVTGKHAAPDGNGNIEWYDIMFEHGVQHKVYTNDMTILLSEMHENHEDEDCGCEMKSIIKERVMSFIMEKSSNPPSKSVTFRAPDRSSAARQPMNPFAGDQGSKPSKSGAARQSMNPFAGDQGTRRNDQKPSFVGAPSATRFGQQLSRGDDSTQFATPKPTPKPTPKKPVRIPPRQDTINKMYDAAKSAGNKVFQGPGGKIMTQAGLDQFKSPGTKGPGGLRGIKTADKDLGKHETNRQTPKIDTTPTRPFQGRDWSEKGPGGLRGIKTADKDLGKHETNRRPASEHGLGRPDPVPTKKQIDREAAAARKRISGNKPKITGPAPDKKPFSIKNLNKVADEVGKERRKEKQSYGVKPSTDDYRIRTVPGSSKTGRGYDYDAMRRDMEDSGEIPSARRRSRSTDPKPKVIAWDQSVMDKITADSNIAKPRS